MMDRNNRRLDKLVEKASCVLSRSLDCVGWVVERCMRRKLKAILDNAKHPLYNILISQRSRSSGLFISLRCRTERFRRSFIPTAIRLFNSS